MVFVVLAALAAACAIAILHKHANTADCPICALSRHLVVIGVGVFFFFGVFHRQGTPRPARARRAVRRDEHDLYQRPPPF
ncbi:MAG: hypothetical protein M5R36_12830 [Deltaproteobacteria bacterium]|nr:hypothetical protein [Deltaproteobacteria bacterium]